MHRSAPLDQRHYEPEYRDRTRFSELAKAEHELSIRCGK
jgi:hypothetical protein